MRKSFVTNHVPSSLVLVVVILAASPSPVHGYDIASDYFSLGGNLFSPSGYNLTAKYSQRYIDFTVSGMYFHPYFGIEGSVDFNLFNTTSFRNGPGIFVGYAHQKPVDGDSKIYNAYQENMPYSGIHYFWELGWFNAAFGIGYGFEAKPFVFPVFNIGAKFDFIDTGNILRVEGPEPRLFRESRDPVLTGIFSLFPGGGYYYLGEWGRGAIATATILVASGSAFATGYVYGSKSSWFIGSYVVYLGAEVFSIVDSIFLSVKPMAD